jgi:hypothetical protein
VTSSVKSGRAQPEWLLPPAYEIVRNHPEFDGVDVADPVLDDPATVAEYGDEIVDDVTVRVITLGLRRVASTDTERRTAVRIMIEKMHLDPQEVAERIGTLVAKLPDIIGPLGYEILPRTDPKGKRVRPTARFQRVGKSVVSVSDPGGRA